VLADRLRAVALVLLTFAAASLGGEARAQPAVPPQADFEWSVPDRFGAQLDDHGQVVEPRPSAVRRGPWPVDLRVSGAACTGAGSYVWLVDETVVERTGKCHYRHRFPAEGSYSVRLEASVDGRELAPRTQQVVVQDWLIVSIGDSVASGESVPDVPDASAARWQSTICHRSARAAPAKAAARIERADEHTSVTFIHLACSGADVRKGLLGPYAGIEPPASGAQQPPQVRVLNGLAQLRRVDAVLVSVGANDVYFGPIVRFCAAAPLARNCFEERFKPPGARAAVPAREAIAQALHDLPGRYDDLADTLSERIRPGRVHIVQYFDPTHDEHGRTCRRILGSVTTRELELARSLVLEPLNQAVAQAGADHGWNVVGGVAERFAEHGYCAGRRAWVTTAGRSIGALGGPRLQARLLGTLHPNEAGHEDTAQLIVASLDRSLYPGQDPPIAVVTAGPDEDDGGIDLLSTAAIVVLVLVGAVLFGAGWLVGRRRRSA
jgi:hypothetical protein